jgi:glycosyltransferase involved in cell wall biosynthesis
MRIGIDARFYGSVGKGLGRYTERLVSELETIDTENTYVIYLCKENFDEYTPKNKNFSKRLTSSRWYSFSEQFFLPFLLMKEKFDVMHFPHFNVPLLYLRPYVVTLHDLILFHYPTEKASTRSALFYWFKFALYRIVLENALLRSKHVITVSEFTRKDIIQNYPFVKNKINVTKEAVSEFCYWQNNEEGERVLRSFSLVSGDAQHGILQPYFLYVGNAYPHKNLKLLLDMAELFPGTLFVFVGKEDFFYKQLKCQVEARNIKNIYFTGYVTEVELGVLYRNALLYIFPSLYEGFGLPPLEAMQYGTPVIASNRGSLPEVLGNAPLYFDPESAPDLANAIRLLRNDKELQEQCRIRGFERTAVYSWRGMAEATLGEYKKIVNGE